MEESGLNSVNSSKLDQGPDVDMSRPGIEPGRASTLGGEHSSKELFEQRINTSYHIYIWARDKISSSLYFASVVEL